MILASITRTLSEACRLHASGPLVERWDGVRWTILDPVNPAGANNGFGMVSCTPGIVCTAVGGSTRPSGRGLGALVERYS